VTGHRFRSHWLEAALFVIFGNCSDRLQRPKRRQVGALQRARL